MEKMSFFGTPLVCVLFLEWRLSPSCLCEFTGFMLKPNGFFASNPLIDLELEMKAMSKLNTGCCL